LKQVYLDFSGCLDLTDEGLLSLSEGIRALTSVEDLNILIMKCPKITEAGFQEITKGLNGLDSIRYLTLNFGNRISATMGHFINVKINAQRLPFSRPEELNLTDQQFVYQLSQALNGFLNLSKFEIIFHGIRITDDGLFELGQSMKRLEFLKDISIELTECNGVTQNGVCQFIVNSPKRWQSIDVRVRIPAAEYPDGKIHEAILKFS